MNGHNAPQNPHNPQNPQNPHRLSVILHRSRSVSLALCALIAAGCLFAGCEADPCDAEDALEGDLFIRDMDDLDEADGVRCITGSLIVGEVEHDASLTGSGVQDFGLSNSVFHLDGLSDLELVEGDIHIAGINTLLNIDGLSSLSHVGREMRFEKNPRGDLIIHQNALLTNIDGLSTLYLSGGNIIVSHNAIMNDVSGMSSLERVGWELKIINNPRLATEDAEAAGEGVAAMGGLIVDENGTALGEGE